ncbi:MAG: NTP transferase domain-containing protein [Methanomassiliicoccales archaeon]|nr:NTP transferase domain-containing protein [Methanomassiliicoccales archaeon]
MKALVLAAGEGTRLRPLTSNIPKPLLVVAGKPFLSHVFHALSSAGVKDIVLLVGWKANRIKEYYGDGSREGIKIHYLEQRERMGTAHAIGVAEKTITGPFICVNGDVVITESDAKEMLAVYERKKSTVMGTVTVKDPRRFGVAEITGGKLKRIIEKPQTPPTDLINAGIFVFDQGIFKEIRLTDKSPRGEYEITDTLNRMARSEEILVHKLKGDWIDVGRPWDLLKANEILMSRMKGRIEGTVEDGTHIIGEVVIEKGARVRSGSYIEGPVYISESCDVGPNCYIRPSTCLGPKCRIGNAVEVKNSIIMSGSHVPHHNYVGDSIIGERCNLGAGTKVANLRFDGKTVKVSFGGKTIDSERRKLGVIMGDNVKTGINSMLDSGTIIWEDAVIGPGALARGNVAPGSKVL